MTPKHVTVAINYVTNRHGTMLGWYTYCHECGFESKLCKSYEATIRKAMRHGRSCKEPEASHRFDKNIHNFGIITVHR